MVGSREWRRKDKIISWEAENSRGGTRVHGGVPWQDKLSDFSASLRTSESKRFPFLNQRAAHHDPNNHGILC
jgi:hypothetical protein